MGAVGWMKVSGVLLLCRFCTVNKSPSTQLIVVPVQVLTYLFVASLGVVLGLSSFLSAFIASFIASLDLGVSRRGRSCRRGSCGRSCRRDSGRRCGWTRRRRLKELQTNKKCRPPDINLHQESNPETNSNTISRWAGGWGGAVLSKKS